MEALDRAIEALAGHAVEIAAGLVAIPSDGPVHDERAVVAALVTAAASLGLPPGVIRGSEPNHPNLILEIGGRMPGRRLILTSHTDTKPPGDEPDPRSAAIRDGRLHGLGSADAKGSVAAMLVAAAALAAVHLPRRGELVLVFSADEESTGRRGLVELAAAGHLAADAAIVGEPSGSDASFDGLPVSARGFVGVTLRARGTRLHSGLAGRRERADPIQTIARAVTDLPALVRLRSSPAILGSAPAPAATAPVEPPRLTVTSIGGGGADGILADGAWIRGEVRTRPGETIQAVEAALQSATAAFVAASGLDDADLDVQVDPIDWPASDVRPSAAIVTALADATEHITGRRPAPTSFPGATEAHVLARLGIPTVPAFGPGLLASAHVAGESIGVDDVRAAVAIYAKAAAAYLG